MELYNLIAKVSNANDSDASWELVLRFKPYIRKICFDEEKQCVDEDMVSDIIVRLHKRILGFKIRRPCEAEH